MFRQCMIEANEISLENIMTSFDFGGSENKIPQVKRTNENSKSEILGKILCFVPYSHAHSLPNPRQKATKLEYL